MIGWSDKNWEQVQDEDLWQDGELSVKQVKENIYNRVVNTGDWVVLRMIDG